MSTPKRRKDEMTWFTIRHRIIWEGFCLFKVRQKKTKYYALQTKSSTENHRPAGPLGPVTTAGAPRIQKFTIPEDLIYNLSYK